jgi:hypothetical protein
MRPLTILSVLAGVAAGCGSQQHAALPSCPPTWRADWVGDSTAALCIPPGFERFDATSWHRGQPADDFFSVEFLQWPDDSASLHAWPPHLGSGPDCLGDCSRVDSLGVHVDSIAGMGARTEVGLVSGGLPGWQRMPMFRTGWILSADRRGFAQGWARGPLTIDTLRQAVRTLQLAGGT